MTTTIDPSSAVTDEQACFISLFEHQAARTPDRVSVVFEEQSVTYQELNRRAEQVARYLIDANVRPEDRVGLCLDRSIDAITAMLGALKVGAAFVPLDPEFPSDRIEFMANDAGIRLVFCESKYRPRFDSMDRPLQLADLAADLPADACPDSEGVEANRSSDFPSNPLAYIMYTSGSTGQPKGVQIEQQALTAYCLADIEVYHLHADDRTVQFSTLNFDIAIEEIFPPLLTGGCVVVRPRDRSSNANELLSIVNEHQVTAIHLATAYWHEWVDLMQATQCRVPECLRLMVVTGEKVSTEHYRRWQTLCDHDVEWCNAYGPTEATVSATVFTPPKGWSGDNMPIGKPLPGYLAYILTSTGQPVGEGQTGELYIGGPGLARGYLNRAELTQAAFAVHTIHGKAVRLYKTGDLARWLPNGDIEFAGRIDHQVKLGSYRIEPGEIEAVANQHPQVLESLVTVDVHEHDKTLIAYIAHGQHALTVESVAEHLRRELPSFMVPARFVLLARFPKTINGKIDRQALPAADQSQSPRQQDVAPPTNELESQMVAIWCDVLGVPKIGIHDDFFALGGSSLLVTRVIAKVSHQFEQEIPVRDFFANPTVASICHQLQSNRQTSSSDSHRDDEICRHIRANLPKIIPSFFDVQGKRLFGVVYAPLTQPVHHNVVICPSYGHEYARSHRNLQQLAVLLARSGCHVLRFDYSSTGNSSGACESGNAEQWAGEIGGAVKYLESRFPATWTTVIGIRFGATLATNADLESVDSLVCWDPVADGERFCQQLDQLHQQTLTSQLRFPVVRTDSDPYQSFGLAMPAAKRGSIAAQQLGGGRHPFGGKVLAVVSDGYLDDEGCSLPDDWQLAETSDSIAWHHADYTESGFSSPKAFHKIVDFTAATRRPIQ